MGLFNALHNVFYLKMKLYWKKGSIRKLEKIRQHVMAQITTSMIAKKFKCYNTWAVPQ